MKPALDHLKFAQVGYIVKDIEKAKERYAKLFGVPVPPSQPCGFGAANTVYKGAPAPDSHCKLAFFDLPPPLGGSTSIPAAKGFIISRSLSRIWIR